MSGTDWMKYAACAGTDPDMWFPGQHAGIVCINRVKAICDRCVCKTTCLEYALEHNEPGVWGGTTANERVKIRRARREVVA